MTETPKGRTACGRSMATDPETREPRRKPVVRLAADDFDGAFEDQPSPYAAAA